MNNRFEICPVEELPAGSRKIVELNGESIGIFNVHGEYHALKNVCPHQMAPLCEGKVTGTNAPGAVGEYCWERADQIIRCPWHGWEFDISTGLSVFNPHRVKARSYEVQVESVRPEQCDATSSDDDETPSSVETYDVEIEQDTVVLYL